METSKELKKKAWDYIGTRHFGKSHFCTDISSPELFSARTFWHENISAWVCFGTMKSNIDILAQSFQHGCPCSKMSMCPKYPCSEMFQCGNVHVPKRPQCTMCWHKDITKFQILLKIILNQPLSIQYERRVADLQFFCIFNGNLIDSIMALLAKIFNFCHFYVVEFQ